MKQIKIFLSIITLLSLLLSIHNVAYATQKLNTSQTSSTQKNTPLKDFETSKERLIQDIVQPPNDLEITNKNMNLLRYMKICSCIEDINAINFFLSSWSFLTVYIITGSFPTVPPLVGAISYISSHLIKLYALYKYQPF